MAGLMTQGQGASLPLSNACITLNMSYDSSAEGVAITHWWICSSVTLSALVSMCQCVPIFPFV